MTQISLAEEESLAETLRAHARSCEHILDIATQENEELAEGGAIVWDRMRARRKDLLKDLETLVHSIRKHRLAWERLSAQERSRDPELMNLLRSNSDLIMRIVALDRENEQILLRRGLLPPQHLPPVNRQRPHFVSRLYQKHVAE